MRFKDPPVEVMRITGKRQTSSNMNAENCTETNQIPLCDEYRAIPILLRSFCQQPKDIFMCSCASDIPHLKHLANLSHVTLAVVKSRLYQLATDL